MEDERPELVPLDTLLKDANKKNFVLGKLSEQAGAFVFDDEGFYRGFLNTNDIRFGGVIPGYDGTVVGVILSDGKIQNPDGTPSNHTNPVEFLLATTEPIREQKYHRSSIEL